MSNEEQETPHVVVKPNGPLLVHGNLEIRDKAGEILKQAAVVALCRCGQSATKPFCDGTHKRINFTAD
jgi:CDGSH-type Zn-finger protein